MYDINRELRDNIVNISNILLDKYKDVLHKDKKEFKSYIEKNVGKIQKLSAFGKEELKKYEEYGGIVGVDGSNNKVGGAAPHYIELYQGLAKSTKHQNKPIIRTDFFTPLYEEVRRNEEDSQDMETDDGIRRRKLAEIELDVALESIDELEPYAILMDGSLIRYDILASKKWELLKDRCEDEGIILVGIIEDIKTSIIGESLKLTEGKEIKDLFYDREMLYGILEYGELINIYDDMTKKSKAGLSSLFLRSSDNPSVIGIDILDSQKKELEDIVRLILAITPRGSRGIPLWLDIVDSEVRIPDKMIRGLLESYMDKSILEVFFVPERDKRTF